jgi:ATP-dependent RNA helicase DeaD
MFYVSAEFFVYISSQKTELSLLLALENVIYSAGRPVMDAQINSSFESSKGLPGSLGSGIFVAIVKLLDGRTAIRSTTGMQPEKAVRQSALSVGSSKHTSVSFSNLLLENGQGAKMNTDFSQLSLHPKLVQAVAERGYETPTPIQTQVIPVMLAGQDVIGQAQTGTGKTAAFALPLLHNLQPGLREVQALVVTPTRELAKQVANAIYEYGQFQNVRVLPAYGGSPYGRQIRRLKDGIDVVVGTPGRLLDLIRRQALDLSSIHIVILDEADEMLSMGFVEDIEALLEATPETRQTALFSATIPPTIRRLADKYLINPESITIKQKELTVESIDQRYYLVNQFDKLAALTRLFEIEDITSALIFTRTRIGSDELAGQLSARGYSAEALNGDLSQDARERTLRRFRNHQVKVLVATDVAARGLDIDDISHVFNYDLPYDVESYVHRIGRTGRAGKTGIAITLITPAEQWRLGRIEKFTRHRLTKAELPTELEIQQHREDHLVEQVHVWLRRGRCAREQKIVAELVEAGHDPLMIAAVALKLARAEEKQRPIESISDVKAKGVGKRGKKQDRQREHRQKQIRFKRKNGRKPDHRSKDSHEEGMVRLSLNTGKIHGVRPSDVVGAIASHADIPGNTIGKIFIQERNTLVDVEEQYVSRVLGKTGSYRVRQLDCVTVERA